MPSHPLKGSEHKPLPGAHSIGRADPQERLEVTIVLRCIKAHELHQRVHALSTPSHKTAFLSREAFAKQFGATDSDLDAVRRFAAENHLAIVQQHAGRRTVILSGTVAQFEAAFGVQLQRFQHDTCSYRGLDGSIYLSDTLHPCVEAVLGLDNRPIAKPHFRIRRPHGNVRWRPAAEGAEPFTPPQVAALYDYPDGTGAGSCVGIIELGGGERPADLRRYFSSLGVSPAPKVTTVSVDQSKNQPTGDANGPDGEVMLDIEIVGAIAPGAHIAVYFTQNTDAGFLDAITTAIHDTTNSPSVISISWGGPESGWTQQSMTAFDSAFQSAAAMGITVCVASGDSGSSDGVTDGADHVDFPASSPHVLACGGTRLQAADGRITGQSVWNDGAQGGAGGGGVSTMFPTPSWQEGLQVTRTDGSSAPLAMRGVPDVSGDADPATGYSVRIDGTDTVVGGTSAVAPLWAALIAIINAGSGRAAGLINPLLYQTPSACTDVTQGNNGDFAASRGWDACTGLGSPIGTQVAALLTSTASS